MSSIIGRTAFRAAPRTAFRAAPRRWASGATAGDGAAVQKEEHKSALKSGAKRDPELIILFVIMSGVFGLAGWHFSSNPTSSSSENSVSKVPGSEPWNTGSDGKYQYHPGGDHSQPRRDAPSALNSVIIPNVNLPKDLHERYNKWGKEGF